MPSEPDVNFESDGTETAITAHAKPQFCLRGISDQVKDQIFVLSTNTMFGRTVIGRSPDCSIVLKSPGVSRQHAAIQIKDGAVTLEDLDSSNGTYVDGVRVKQALLAPGQEIIFESLRFVFEPLTSSASKKLFEHEENTMLLAPGVLEQKQQVKSSGAKTWVILLLAALLIAAAIVAGAWFFTSN